MISTESLNYIKYFSKYAIIIIIIFLILKYSLNTKISEAILLAFIIGVTIIIIENIISINSYISDPLNCDQCKVNLDDNKKDTFETSNLDDNYDDNNYDVNDDVNNDINHEDFENNSEFVKMGKNIIDEVSKNISKTINNIVNRTPSPKTDNFNNLNNDIQNYINNQSNINNNIIENFESEATIEPTVQPVTSGIPTKPEATISEATTSAPEATSEATTSAPEATTSAPEATTSAPEATTSAPDNTIPATIPAAVSTTTQPTINPSFDANYVQYQQDGLQAQAANESLKRNLFNLNMGDRAVTEQYIGDAKKYYDQILSYSTNAPSTFSAMENELKYSNYNYITPLNKGMANKEYTFVSPTNWYPIPPVPPVCVTNKSCTTCPVQMTDGKDYMQWASLEDFDKARRFTGDMNINIDYIKNVLNNPDGN